jgi:hypothetical protein
MESLEITIASKGLPHRSRSTSGCATPCHTSLCIPGALANRTAIRHACVRLCDVCHARYVGFIPITLTSPLADRFPP